MGVHDTGQDTGEDQIEEIARMIYAEINRQIDADQPGTSAVIEAGGLRHVLIEGRIDLVRLAAALARRLGLAVPEIETVGDPARIAPPATRLGP